MNPKSVVAFKKSLLRILQFLLLPQNPNGFCSRKLWELIFLVLEPWAWWSRMGLRSLTPKVSLLFFIYQMKMWYCPFPSLNFSAQLCVPMPLCAFPLLCFLCTFLHLSAPPPLIPLWMNVVSLNPWLPNLHTA